MRLQNINFKISYIISITIIQFLNCEQHNKSNGSVNRQINTISSSDIVRASASHPHLSQLEQLKESHKERSGSGTMYRPDILYQVLKKTYFKDFVTDYAFFKGSLLNIPEYSRSRNDLSGSGAINRYGSLKHSTHLSQSGVSYITFK